MEFQEDNSSNKQLAVINSNESATFTFDDNQNNVTVISPLLISPFPTNNYTSTWKNVHSGELLLEYGSDNNNNPDYKSIEEFTTKIEQNGAQIDGNAGNFEENYSLDGVVASFSTSKEKDSISLDKMPTTSYSTWGFWNLDASALSAKSNSIDTIVDSGMWVAGDIVPYYDLPYYGSASMSGGALLNVASSFNQEESGGVQQYIASADVEATFDWDFFSYTGVLAFKNFDKNNPIIENAGFTSFSVDIKGQGETYSGFSSNDIDNAWQGGASLVGAFYGDNSPDESGGRISVNLHKSTNDSSSGANDFYIAVGIYLIN